MSDIVLADTAGILAHAEELKANNNKIFHIGTDIFDLYEKYAHMMGEGVSKDNLHLRAKDLQEENVEQHAAVTATATTLEAHSETMTFLDNSSI